MNEAVATSQLETNQAPPLVNAGAVVGGSAIGLGLAVIAGTLWTGEALTGAHRIFYDHLAWWFGGTLIGAAFIGSLIAAGGLMPRPLLAQIGPSLAARRLQRAPVDNRSRVA